MTHYTTATPNYAALLQQTLKTFVRWTCGVGLLKVKDTSPLAQILENPNTWSALQAKLATLLQYSDFIPNPQQTYETLLSWQQPGATPSDINSTITNIISSLSSSLHTSQSSPSWIIFNRMPLHIFDLSDEECMKVPRVRDNAD